MGERTSDDVVAWAADEVARGRDTSALVALASLSPGADGDVVDGLLVELLGELGLPSGELEQLRLVAASVLPREIVDGTRGLIEGSRRISMLGLGEPPAPELAGLWAVLSEWEDNPELRDAYAQDLRDETARIASWDATAPTGP